MSIRGNGHGTNGEMNAWLKRNFERLDESVRELKAMHREMRADQRRQEARLALLERAGVEARRQNREIVAILSDIERRNKVELARGEARMKAHEIRNQVEEATNQRAHERFMAAMDALIVRINRVEKKP